MKRVKYNYDSRLSFNTSRYVKRKTLPRDTYKREQMGDNFFILMSLFKLIL